MKKIILLLAAVVAMMAAQAQHVEFKWHGFYGIVGYDFTTNLNNPLLGDSVAVNGKFNGFTAVAGFQMRKESGLGVGCSFMKDPTGAFSQLPIFVEVRSHFIRNRITPYTTVYVGYSIPLGSSSTGEESIQITKGGVTSGFNVGARFAVSRKFGINVFAGYQELYMTGVMLKRNGLKSDEEPILFHNIKAGVGFNF